MSTQGMLYLPLPALNHAFAYPNTQHLHSLSYLSIHITSPRLSRTISAHLPDPNRRPIIDQVDYRQGSFVFKAPVLKFYCLELPCFTSGRRAHDSLLWRLSWPPPSHVPLRNHAHPLRSRRHLPGPRPHAGLAHHNHDGGMRRRASMNQQRRPARHVLPVRFPGACLLAGRM
jgi:hypothetical protein